MARKKTRAELEAEAALLRPYQYLAWMLLKKEKPVKLKSGEYECLLYGAGKPHGGIVLVNDISAHFACDWAHSIETRGGTYDPYLRELASLIRREQKRALEEANR